MIVLSFLCFRPSSRRSAKGEFSHLRVNRPARGEFAPEKKEGGRLEGTGLVTIPFPQRLLDPGNPVAPGPAQGEMGFEGPPFPGKPGPFQGVLNLPLKAAQVLEIPFQPDPEDPCPVRPGKGPQSPARNLMGVASAAFRRTAPSMDRKSLS